MPTNNGNNNSRGYLACEEGVEQLPFSLRRFLFPFCPRYTPFGRILGAARRPAECRLTAAASPERVSSLSSGVVLFLHLVSTLEKNEEERRDAPPAMGCCNSPTNFQGTTPIGESRKAIFFCRLRSALIVECTIVSYNVDKKYCGDRLT